jgi:hypothetical protein
MRQGLGRDAGLETVEVVGHGRRPEEFRTSTHRTVAWNGKRATLSAHEPVIRVLLGHSSLGRHLCSPSARP